MGSYQSVSKAVTLCLALASAMGKLGKGLVNYYGILKL